MRALTFLMAAVALMGTCSVASAQAFSEDFESYASGSALHGQAGWKGWDNVAGAGAPTSSTYAYSGKNSVEVIGSADLVHEFALAGGRWVFSTMQFIPKGAAGSTYFILLNQYRDGGPNDWSIQLNFNLTTGVVTAEAQGGGVTAEVVYDRWVEHKFIIDLISNTCDWYYAGALIASHPWDDNTHGTLQAIDLYGNGASSVYYDDITITPYVLYQAYNPRPADGEMGVLQPLLQWTKGDTALFHDVYLGTRPDLTEGDRVGTMQPFPMYYHIPGLQPGVTYYWRIDEIEADLTVHTGEVWSFTAMPLTAFAPAPADGSGGVFHAPVLSWKPPQDATAHHVYFSDDLAAVEAGDAAADKGAVADTSFDAGLLRAGTTYYWRVDETDTPGAVQTGSVWSFTTGQPVTGRIVREWWTGISGTTVALLTDDPRYPSHPTGREMVNFFEGPVDWRDNYGSRLYGWLVPPKSGEYTFWVASDDFGELWLSTDADPAHKVRIADVPGWTPAQDFDNTGGGVGGPAQKSAAITLTAGQKYYIEALMKEGGGGDNIAVAWQPPGEARVVIPAEHMDTFALAPLKAASPSPKNGATDTAQSLTLSWFAGEKAIRHDVYFGDDAAAVALADASGSLYQGGQAGDTWDTGDLEWGKTYFWRVDEIADGDPQSPWKGAVWSFTTADFIPVDDFESYTDDMDAEEAIYQTWIDGLTNGTGSYVGYEFATGGTFGETGIVHGGGQSMPLDYNNVSSPYYSEAERTWSAAQDWTVNGVDSLVLYVRGKSTNDPAVLYVALEDSAGKVAVVSYADDTASTATSWLEWKVPLSSFAGVNLARIKTMYIGAGDRSSPVAGGQGIVYIDDIRVVKP